MLVQGTASAAENANGGWAVASSHVRTSTIIILGANLTSAQNLVQEPPRIMVVNDRVPFRPLLSGLSPSYTYPLAARSQRAADRFGGSTLALATEVAPSTRR